MTRASDVHSLHHQQLDPPLVAARGTQGHKDSKSTTTDPHVGRHITLVWTTSLPPSSSLSLRLHPLLEELLKLRPLPRVYAQVLGAPRMLQLQHGVRVRCPLDLEHPLVLGGGLVDEALDIGPMPDRGSVRLTNIFNYGSVADLMHDHGHQPTFRPYMHGRMASHVAGHKSTRTRTSMRGRMILHIA